MIERHLTKFIWTVLVLAVINLIFVGPCRSSNDNPEPVVGVNEDFESSHQTKVELFAKLFSKNEADRLDFDGVLKLIKQIAEIENSSGDSITFAKELLELGNVSSSNCGKLNYFPTLEWHEAAWSKSPNLLPYVKAIKSKQMKICKIEFESEVLLGYSRIKPSVRRIVHDLREAVKTRGVFVAGAQEPPLERFNEGVVVYLINKTKENSPDGQSRYQLREAREEFLSKFNALRSACRKFYNALGPIWQFYARVSPRPQRKLPDQFIELRSSSTLCHFLLRKDGIGPKIGRKFIAQLTKIPAVEADYNDDADEFNMNANGYGYESDDDDDDNHSVYSLVDRSLDEVGDVEYRNWRTQSPRHPASLSKSRSTSHASGISIR